MSDGQVIFDIRGDSSKLDGDLKKAEQTITKGVGVAMAAIGSLAAAVGAAAVTAADGLDKSVNQVTASLGLSQQAADKYRDTIKQIYSDNYGESFEDIANSIGLIKQQMTDISDDELVKVTESAYLLADVYEIDVAEGIRGANAMVKQFGISAEEAYNLIAQGAEKGLNQNGDIADQLSEYSTYYAQLGFSAEDALNMMSTAAENGVYQIDYLNDAIKEFGIRAIDCSATTTKGFEAISLDAAEMGQAFAVGGDSAKKAFQTVITKLADMDNELEQDAAGVALFGTKWEDLGKDAVLALSETGDAIDKTRDKLSEMEDVKYESLSDQLAAIKRNIELLLEPLGQELIPVIRETIDELMPIVEELIPEIAETAKALISFIAKDVIPCLVNVISFVVEYKDVILLVIAALLELKIALAITSLIQGFSTAMGVATAAQTAFNAALAANPIGLVATALAALCVGIGVYVSTLGESYTETEKMCQETDKLIEKSEELRGTLEKNRQARADGFAELEAEAGATDVLADKLFALSEQEELNAYDKQEMLAIVEQLNEAIPDLGLSIDEQTGKLSKQKDEVYALIEANKKMYLVEAQKGYLTEIAEDISNAEILLQKIKAEKEPLEREYAKKYQEWLNWRAAADAGNYYSTDTDLSADMQVLRDAIKGLTFQEDLYSSVLASADEEWRTRTNYINENSTAIQGNAEAIENQLGKFKAVTENGEEYLQKLKDTNQATSDLTDSANDLASAFKEQAEHGSLSVDTMLDLIDKGYASILVIDEETNAVRLNAQAYEDLQRAKIKAQKIEVQRQITEISNGFYHKATELAMQGIKSVIEVNQLMYNTTMRNETPPRTNPRRYFYAYFTK